jgi:hypothetical protein
MQLTFRVHLPKGITPKEERTARRIEKFLIKEVKSKFGKQISLGELVPKGNLVLTKQKRLTVKEKVRKYKAIHREANNASRLTNNRRTVQKIWDRYYLQVYQFGLEDQASITRQWLLAEINRITITRNRNE